MFKKIVFSLFIVSMLVGPLTTNASTFTSLKAQLEYISNKISNFSSDVKGEVLGVTSSDIIVNLSASPSAVPFGGSTTLTWTTVNATSCIADGISPSYPGSYTWLGAKSLNGSQIINNIDYYTYFFLRCYGPSGQTSASVLVSIKNINPKIELQAVPNVVNSGGSSVISYKVTEADSCETSSTPYYSNWHWYSANSPSYQGSTIIKNITENSVFNISCIASGKTFVRSVTVNVKTTGPQCDYPVPPKDCTYIKGPNYNPSTNCGLILDCKVGDAGDDSKIINTDTSSSKVTTTNNFCSFTFTKNLSYGNVDSKNSKDVSYLQSVLVDEKLLPSSVATGKFYSQTQTALKNFQKKYNLSQTGKVDANTRIKLNSLFQDYCNNI